MQSKSDNQMTVIKLVRGITYVVYGFTIIAVVSLALAFFLLLFSANQSTPFVKFIYQIAYDFGQPFRGIFPPRPIGETGYFSTTALFAIVMYLFFAAAINALIGYINLKMAKHQHELNELERKVQKN
jgi:uncharacterized protein YggT (Ycf19 family)